MKECGQCRGVFYCNRLCQKKHWERHRQECEGFEVHVYGFDGETIDIKKCKYAETVESLKRRITTQVYKRDYGLSSSAVWKFRLIYGIRCLKKKETLGNVGVRRDAEIQIVTGRRKKPRLTEELADSDSMPDLVDSSSSSDSSE
jgi:hypothetical protein